MTWRYHMAGLTIDSAVAVPDWTIFAIETDGPADVTIVMGEAMPAVPSDARGIDGVAVAWIIALEIAQFHIVAGRTITIHPHPDVPTRQWLPFLLGSGWNALCLQRGLLLLHASVIAGADGAVMFCGGSGAGKSTMAAHLVERGYRLISDDLCRIAPGPPAQVYPSAPRLRLWGDSLRVLGKTPEVLPRVLDGRDKYYLAVERPGISPVPLRGIHLLEWGEPKLVRVAGLEALSALVRDGTYRPETIEAMGMTPRHWNQCLQLLQAVPAHVFRRPKDADRLADAVDLLRLGRP